MSAQETQPALNFETFVETFYSSGVAQFNAGSREIVYPDNIPSAIITAICERFSKLFRLPVTTTHDPERHVIALKAHAVVESSKKDKIPRPPNAFILYRTHHHQSIKEQNPGIANNDISKIIAVMWKAEPDKVKKTWKGKAEKVKDEHAKKHPNYSYQPRKPSEKKRRMTKRKLALIQEAEDQIAASQDSSPTPQADADFDTPQVSPEHIMDMLPMRPDDPMIREFELPTSTAAIKQFEHDIFTYNTSQCLLPVQQHPVLESSFTESVIREHHTDVSELEALFSINSHGGLFDHIASTVNPQDDSQPISRQVWNPAVTDPALAAIRNKDNNMRMSAERFRQRRLESEDNQDSWLELELSGSGKGLYDFFQAEFNDPDMNTVHGLYDFAPYEENEEHNISSDFGFQ